MRLRHARRHWSALLHRRAQERAREAGAVAIVAAFFISTCFFGLAAIGVDTARWAMVGEDIQKAADAAALSGVTFLPTDFTSAQSTALVVASLNGFPVVTGKTTVTVALGSQPSQLKVTISNRVENSFGAAIGTPTTWVTRTGVADYTAPAPMGNPCNVFGNEPPSQPTTTGQATGQKVGQPTTSALPSPVPANCSATPQFWATIEGPQTDKVQGDRYSTSPCTTTGTWGCASSKNSESRSEGYFFAVHVEPAAVNTPIEVQLYDPAFVFTSKDCSSITYTPSTDNLNDYASTDARLRYRSISSAAGAAAYCSGDYFPGTSGTAMTTSFGMREQTNTGDPLKAPVIAGCTKQFRGFQTVPSVNSLTKTSTANYNKQLARVFHQWVPLCTFTPTRKGDWFLQVRTNTALPTTGGDANTNSFAPVVYNDNASVGNLAGNSTTGFGNNSFGIRAVPSSTALRSQVAVSGFARMPIFQNATGSTATFNLIRALSNTKNQYIAFDFYDAADGSGTSGGSVKVLPPLDAVGTVKATSGIPNCRGALNNNTYTSLTACSVAVKPSTHDGQLQHMIVPIPGDYSCTDTSLTGCWFRVQITFSSGVDVSDITTWDANINGDPVRLIK